MIKLEFVYSLHACNLSVNFILKVSVNKVKIICSYTLYTEMKFFNT